ncbi:hypothetical protein LTR95_010468 [Oleoguttula sp. CCFEE 5521]
MANTTEILATQIYYLMRPTAGATATWVTAEPQAVDTVSSHGYLPFSGWVWTGLEAASLVVLSLVARMGYAALYLLLAVGLGILSVVAVLPLTYYGLALATIVWWCKGTGHLLPESWLDACKSSILAALLFDVATVLYAIIDNILHEGAGAWLNAMAAAVSNVVVVTLAFATLWTALALLAVAALKASSCLRDGAKDKRDMENGEQRQGTVEGSLWAQIKKQWSELYPPPAKIVESS